MCHRRPPHLIRVLPLALAVPAAAAGVPPVEVIVDMDAATPGIQSSITVTAGTAVVEDIAVYIRDPLEQRTVWAIGYLGGLDRGIAFGHMPGLLDIGQVTGMTATPVAPVNPANTAWVDHPPLFDPGFVGPEVQYMEFGAAGSATIPAQPAAPVFRVDVTLSCAAAGDRFEFFLLDVVTVWNSGGSAGAFSTTGPLSLDTGGDAVPDATRTIYGVDPDAALPVPPGAFPVDYIDGPPATGPAVIEVIAPPADLDGDGAVTVGDLLLVLARWGGPDGDVNGDGTTDVADLLAVLAQWGGCP